MAQRSSPIGRGFNVEDIRIDGGTQPRVKTNEAYVDELVEHIAAGEKLPPVIVYNDGKDFWLADGFHRYLAHKRAGKTKIDVEIRTGTLDDAILFSLGANATHGLRRTNEDKRAAVEKMLKHEKWGKWSDREIARRCGVSHNFVSDLRSSLSSDDSENRSYVTKHGTTATMNTANIGKSQREEVPPSDDSAIAIAQDEDEAEVARDETGKPKDEEGHVISDPEIQDVFRERPLFASLMHRLSAIKGEVNELATKHRSGWFINQKETFAEFDNLHRALRFAQPHSLCPYCGGRKCEQCKQAGWMPEGKYKDGVPSDVKAGA